VQPNLLRIPAKGDGRARAILQRAGSPVTRELVDSLDQDDALALGRYGARQATVALRGGSAERLREGLLAAGISQLRHEDDARDLMVGLALHHVVAQRLGQIPKVLFDDVASCLPAGPVPELLRQFGARQDVTLRAFGWEEVNTVDGPDFVPAIPGS
jgi:hypothetical protein